MTEPTRHKVAEAPPMCLERVAEVATRLESELAKAIVGQRRVVREIPVTSETDVSAEVPLLVESRARHARPSVLQSIPELTGGIRVRADDLDPLVRHFRSLPRTTHSVAMHPMRSGWWWCHSPQSCASNGRCGVLVG